MSENPSLVYSATCAGSNCAGVVLRRSTEDQNPTRVGMNTPEDSLLVSGLVRLNESIRSLGVGATAVEAVDLSFDSILDFVLSDLLNSEVRAAPGDGVGGFQVRLKFHPLRSC